MFSWTMPTNKEGTAYVFSVKKPHKKHLRNVKSSQQPKIKARIMFFKVTMQQDSCC